jgi:hypothetical protein
MKFDITNIDKKSLLKALYSFSTPKGMGVVEFDKSNNIENLSDSECDEMLLEFTKSTKGGIFTIADYYKGKPLKIFFNKSKKGRITVSADGYDSLNGVYSFFDIMLKTFLFDEILVTKKWSALFVNKPSKNDFSAYKRYSLFVQMIKNAVECHNDYGRYWQIQKNDFNKLKEFDYISKL